MAIAKKEELPEELQRIWDEMIMPVDTNISFDSVILSDENKEKYKAFIKEQQYRDTLYSYGLEPMNRLLLYGASGTGKTYSLKALSNLLQYTMIYVDIAKSLSDGNVAKNISDIFKLGNYIADNYDGCIVFFDECDAIAWNRDTANGEGGVARRATNSIFQCVDQMSHHKDDIYTA
jgi:SpoVK/Ycf46/Vps4 family AAA+-type ATPase